MLRALVMLVLFAAPARAEALLGAETYAVIAGVLEWDDPGLDSFPKEGRKDLELFERLGRLGVPASQRTLLLDGYATANAVTRSIARAVARAPAGSTLLIYFAGHGVKEGGEIIFTTADTRLDALAETGLHLDALPKLVVGFKGARIILMADCCYSGGLVAVAKTIGKRVPVLVLTSAAAANLSTRNWTFTQTVIDALSGRALLDRDDDGSISVGELVTEVREGMRKREGQRAGYVSYDVADGLIVARAGRERGDLEVGSGKFERRDWVTITHDGERQVARILGSRGPRLLVELYDYATATQVWVLRKAARPW